jgi:hypothetical protein
MPALARPPKFVGVVTGTLTAAIGIAVIVGIIAVGNLRYSITEQALHGACFRFWSD